MKIIEKRLAELCEYENNPRNNEEAVDKVAASIKEFGFKVPIIIDSDNIIIAGHTRYKAAQSLDFGKVPCIVADDLTPEQVKAFRLADNKVSEFSNWDWAKLDEELEALSDIDMSAFGFAASEEIDIDSFFEDAEPKEKEPKKIKCPHCGKEFEA